MSTATILYVISSQFWVLKYCAKSGSHVVAFSHFYVCLNTVQNAKKLVYSVDLITARAKLRVGIVPSKSISRYVPDSSMAEAP